MDTTDVRITQRSWVVGGVLLLAAVLLAYTTESFQPVAAWVGLLSPLAFGAACIVFAWGFSDTESITARRPVGTGALILLGVWTPVAAVVMIVLGGSLEALQAFSITDGVVSFALALVAVVMIGRARIVPRPWNWTPAWCLAAITTVRVIDSVFAAIPNPDPTAAAPLLAFLSALTSVGSLLGLGVLAIIHGLAPSSSSLK
ncbi:MAG: hypothetical protein QM626_02050 [Microbacterium sp.]|uniref:hypothetical protein n=1 Tax=Microbacterium sp. TaxID=51671 RepID=UPI0039E333B1